MISFMVQLFSGRGSRSSSSRMAVGGGFVLIENGINRVDDRRAHAGLAGGIVDGERVGHALGDHAERVDGLFERLAVAEREADAVVARVLGETGDDEVADAGEAGEGFLATAERHAEAGHFRKRAGDERGHGVVAEAEAVGHAGGDGIDVLDGAAEFDAGDVVAGVNAEMRQGEKFLQGLGKLGVFARRPRRR